jgi:transposase-like protein
MQAFCKREVRAGLEAILINMNLVRLAREYDYDNKCREYLEELAWPNGARCPRCGSEKISRIEKGHQYDYDSCRYQFSVTAGTIFSRQPPARVGNGSLPFIV